MRHVASTTVDSSILTAHELRNFVFVFPVISTKTNGHRNKSASDDVVDITDEEDEADHGENDDR